MAQDSIPALSAPPTARDNPFTRSIAGMIGLAFLGLVLLACVATLPWTLQRGAIPWGAARFQTAPDQAALAATPRYSAGSASAGRLSPAWWGVDADEAERLNALVDPEVVEAIAAAQGASVAEVLRATSGPMGEALRPHWPRYPLGTDLLGRDLLIRCLAGGGISLGIGIAAALISVLIGTLYGATSAYLGGKADAVMMRIVDILYGLPYILLVVLLAVASDAALDEYVNRTHARARALVAEARLHLAAAGEPTDETSVERVLASDADLRSRLMEVVDQNVPERPIEEWERTLYDIITLLVAIGGVSWLTMARVVRGQVLSLKAQPFMEAARALGIPPARQFFRHLLPNLLGPIIVYATLTVPQAILQESFLSFLGIGVKPPLPSWGNLAAEGLSELNSYKSHWWLLLFPCLLLGSTLLALNFVGEGLREAFDPRRARR
jgi:oligopeptide transport system permease protein